MIAIIDLDVRALDADRLEVGVAPEHSILARVGRAARFAARGGLDAVGVVARFSAMRGPGALKALQGPGRAEEGLLQLGDGARVLAGAALRTDEGVEAICYGGAAALLDLAHAFPRSLFDGFRPCLSDLGREARARGLLLLARADGDVAIDILGALDRPAVRDVSGLLLGPATRPPRGIGRVLGLPLSGGSGARGRAGIGARRTALDLDELSFEGIRRAFREGAVTIVGTRGALEQAVVTGAAAMQAVIENVRWALGA